MPPAPPTCWSCGYNLTGLRVEQTCPECGVTIWTHVKIPAATRHAQHAMVWGIVSLILSLVCIGPLAGLVAIIPLYYARLARREARAHRGGRVDIGGATAGRVLAWITVAISLAWLTLYLVLVILENT